MGGLEDNRDHFYDVLFSTLLANGFACPAPAIARCIALLRLPAGVTGTQQELAEQLRRRVSRGELGVDRPKQGPPYYFLNGTAQTPEGCA